MGSIQRVFIGFIASGIYQSAVLIAPEGGSRATALPLEEGGCGFSCLRVQPFLGARGTWPSSPALELISRVDTFLFVFVSPFVLFFRLCPPPPPHPLQLEFVFLC